MPPRSLVAAVLQRYWRVSRGLELAVAVAVVDQDRRYCLVRGVDSLWSLPQTHVRKGENAESAARRLLASLSDDLTPTPMLHGLYAALSGSHSRHVALYVVRGALLREAGKATRYAASALPPDACRHARARIAEIESGAAPDPHW